MCVPLRAATEGSEGEGTAALTPQGRGQGNAGWTCWHRHEAHTKDTRHYASPERWERGLGAQRAGSPPAFGNMLAWWLVVSCRLRGGSQRREAKKHPRAK